MCLSWNRTATRNGDRHQRWSSHVAGRGLCSSLCSFSPSFLRSFSSLTTSTPSLPTVKTQFLSMWIFLCSLSLSLSLSPRFSWLFFGFRLNCVAGRRDFLDELSSFVRILPLISKPDQFYFVLFELLLQLSLLFGFRERISVIDRMEYSGTFLSSSSSSSFSFFWR